MKIKYYIYILEKLLTMPKKGNVKKNVSKQVKKAKQQKGGGWRAQNPDNDYVINQYNARPYTVGTFIKLLEYLFALQEEKKSFLDAFKKKKKNSLK